MAVAPHAPNPECRCRCHSHSRCHTTRSLMPGPCTSTPPEPQCVRACVINRASWGIRMFGKKYNSRLACLRCAGAKHAHTQGAPSARCAPILHERRKKTGPAVIRLRAGVGVPALHRFDPKLWGVANLQPQPTRPTSCELPHDDDDNDDDATSSKAILLSLFVIDCLSRRDDKGRVTACHRVVSSRWLRGALIARIAWSSSQAPRDRHRDNPHPAPSSVTLLQQWCPGRGRSTALSPPPSPDDTSCPLIPLPPPASPCRTTATFSRSSSSSSRLTLSHLSLMSLNSNTPPGCSPSSRTPPRRPSSTRGHPPTSIPPPRPPHHRRRHHHHHHQEQTTSTAASSSSASATSAASTPATSLATLRTPRPSPSSSTARSCWPSGPPATAASR